MLADDICYWKMTSFMALDGVTPFLCLKDATNTCKLMPHTLKDFKNAKNENYYFLHPEHFLPSVTDKNG